MFACHVRKSNHNFRGVIPHLRWSSSSSPPIQHDLETSLCAQLTSRRLPLLYDYLSPQPSFLLQRSLQDFLPSTLPTTFPSSSATTLPLSSHALPLPPGHHLAYFATPTTASQLLPDGTDILHSPGPPFNRRLWASGRIRFPPLGGPLLDCSRAVCIESIREVNIRGQQGTDSEKVLVTIERRIANVQETETESSIRSRIWTPDPKSPGEASIIERRNLIFLRDIPPSTSTTSSTPPRKPLLPPASLPPPTITHTLLPTPSLLFRYSALMFNAHAIHLDPIYTRLQENHPTLLVQGALLLTLLLETLRSHLPRLNETRLPQNNPSSTPPPKTTIREITYRNLSPVYLGEMIQICIREKDKRRAPEEKNDMMGKREWDTYILGPDGGMRVKGTVVTMDVDEEERMKGRRERGTLLID